MIRSTRIFSLEINPELAYMKTEDRHEVPLGINPFTCYSLPIFKDVITPWAESTEPSTHQTIQTNTRMDSTAPGGSRSAQRKESTSCSQTSVCKARVTLMLYMCLMRKMTQGSCWEYFMVSTLPPWMESIPRQTICLSYSNQMKLIPVITPASMPRTVPCTNQVKKPEISFSAILWPLFTCR